jgi:hypothetical protein
MLPTLLLRRPARIVAAECIRFPHAPLIRKHQMERKFSEMTFWQKSVFVMKLALCLISFGFIYPHILND